MLMAAKVSGSRRRALVLLTGLGLCALMALVGGTPTASAHSTSQGPPASCEPPTRSGSDGHDLLFGGDEADRIDARGGIDIIFGGSGDDALCGGPDNDVLLGGPGSNFLDGGAGIDACVAGPESEVIRCEIVLGGATERPDADPPAAVDDEAETDEDSAVPVDVVANDGQGAGGLEVTAVDTSNTAGAATIDPDGTLVYDPTGTFDHLPATGQTTDEVTYTATDDAGATTSAVLTVTVLGVNDAPTATDDAFETDEDTAIVLDLLGNDADADDGAVLTVELPADVATAGQISVSDEGVVTYDPAGAFDHLEVGDRATETFAYDAVDEHGARASATVTVGIDGRDEPTVPAAAIDDTASTSEDGAVVVDVLDNDTGTGITVTSTDDSGTAASASTDGSTVTFDPTGALDHIAQGASSTETITYEITDRDGGTDTATVTVTVDGVNDTPSAGADESETDEDTPIDVSVLGNDTDPDDGAVLTVDSIDTSATTGQAELQPDGTIAYDPRGAFDWLSPGRSATDRIGYSITDEHGASASAAVTVTVTGLAEEFVPAAATDDTARTDEAIDVEISVLANDTGDGISITSIDDTGTVGTVTTDGTTVEFDPAGAFETLALGAEVTDTFTYTITDAEGGTDTATVTVTVTGLNDPPEADDDRVSSEPELVTDEDTPIEVDVLDDDVDIDGDDFSITAVDTAGLAGTVTIAPDGGSLTYDPAGELDHLRESPRRPFAANVDFRYTITDEHGATDTALVTIRVTGVNDPPVAVDDAYTTDEATPITFTPQENDSDPDDTVDEFSQVFVGTSGTVGKVTTQFTGAGNTVTYDPNRQFDYLAPGEEATDSFSYQLRDPSGGVGSATVTITITGLDQAASAADDAATTDEDTATSIDVLANDVGTDLTISELDDDATVGVVTTDGSQVEYDPAGAFEHLPQGETATDSFEYTATDHNGGTDTATVTVTIDGRNDAPVVEDDDATTDEDTPVSIAVLDNDSDPDDGDTLIITELDTSQTLGTATAGDDGVISYDPRGAFDDLEEGETATDTFDYEVRDEVFVRRTATVTVTVHGREEPILPAGAVDDAATTNEHTPVTIDVLANDAGFALEVVSVDAEETTGAVVTDGVRILFNPALGFRDLDVGETATDSFDYTIEDSEGRTDTATVVVTIHGLTGGQEPTRPDSVAGLTSFLYEGPDAVQLGVAPGTIARDRANVVSGVVLDRDQAPIAGARVEVADHLEFGHTVTDEDGEFELVVNGGGRLTLVVTHDGHLDVDRTIEVRASDYTPLYAPIVLTPMDTAMTTIDLESDDDLQVHRASVESDDDGTRRASLFFLGGTDAVMTLPDGSQAPLSTLDVRATEYTVGETGPDAMPGDLPAASGYTYAVELSVDQAQEAGATRVDFSQPVTVYVDDFLGFDVGGIVPLGYYDRELHRWVPADDGVVVRVLDVVDGSAVLDVDGSETAATTEQLAELGVTPAELVALADSNAAGDVLWRVQVDHFTPWDHNWPFGPPEDAEAPDEDERDPDNDDTDDDDDGRDCGAAGSFVGCLDQSLREMIPITGSPFTLAHSSRFTDGYVPERSFDVRISGPAPINPLIRRIHLQVDAAGRTLVDETYPALSDQVVSIVWDGKNQFGHDVMSALAHVRIGYEYDGDYQVPSSVGQAFAQPGSGTAITGDRSRETVTIWREWVHEIQDVTPPEGIDLGGWMLDAQQLQFDNGRRRLEATGSVDSVEPPGSISQIAIEGAGDCLAGCDEPVGVSDIRFRASSIAVADDGSMFMLDVSPGFCNPRIWRIAPNRTEMELVGARPGNSSCSTQADDLEILPDGSLVYAELYSVVHVDLDGTFEVIAGNGEDPSFHPRPQGVPVATDVAIQSSGVGITPDGTVLITDDEYDVVWQLTGSGRLQPYVDVLRPQDVVADDDGNLFVYADEQIVRVRPDGSTAVVAGAQTSGIGQPRPEPTPAMDFVFATPDSVNRGGQFLDDQELEIAGDHLYFVNATSFQDENGFAERARALFRLDLGEEQVEWVAGTGQQSGGTQAGTYARLVDIQSSSVAVDDDGAIYLASNGFDTDTAAKVRIPSQILSIDDPRTELLVPSPDGTLLHEFLLDGPISATYDAVTGDRMLSYDYDAAGRLLSIADRDGEATVIERDPSTGAPTAVVAPTGERTTLAMDAAGMLAEVTHPDGSSHTMEYGPTGLLTAFTDRNGETSSFSYAPDGRLESDLAPDGHEVNLTRVLREDGYTVERTTAEGRTTVYEHTVEPDGSLTRRVTSPTGEATTWSRSPEGVTTYEAVDGATIEIETGPDPRFGLSAPVPVRTVMVTPAGEVTTTYEREVVEAGDGLGVDSLVDSATVNGRTTTRAYDGTTRTVTMTTPGGHERSLRLDDDGRLAERRLDGMADPIVHVHDEVGNLSSVSIGAASDTFAYDDRDRLIRSESATGMPVEVTYDDANLPVSWTDGNLHTLEYVRDPAGRVVGVVTPTGVTHSFDLDEAGALQSYDVPGGGSFEFDRDSDRNLVRTTLADGSIIARSRDAEGRLTTITTPEATTTIDYAGTGSRAGTITRSAAGVDETIGYVFDGRLVTEQSQSGSSSGTFRYDWDPLLVVGGITLESGSDTVEIPIERDGELLATTYGPFTLTRGGPGGATTQITDGNVVLDRTYDARGLPAGWSLSVDGNTAYDLDVTRDADDRVVARNDSVDGSSSGETFDYDAAGQLVTATRDASTTTYAYDANGNRTDVVVDGTPRVASYDQRDRLLSLDGTTYGYDANGFLTTRGADSFDHGAEGELLAATVGGTEITYAHDGVGRRVARTGPDGTHEYLYGNLQDHLEVTAVRAPSGQLTTYYYDDAGALFALERGGAWFYVGTDHLGSPRVVVDATGAIVREIEYGPWGDVLSDTDPTFDLAVGFAGGLADPDTGLVTFGRRSYDPDAGRWTTTDPILFAGGSNLYRYVENDPINLVDPVGTISFEGSAYSGIGGGGKLSITGDGISFCASAGFGLGGGFDVGNGDLDEHSFGTEFQGKVGAGPAAVTVGVDGGIYLDGPKVDDCGNRSVNFVNPKLEGELGPLKFNGIEALKGNWDKAFGVNEQATEAGRQSEALEKLEWKGRGVKAQASASYKYCNNFLW